MNVSFFLYRLGELTAAIFVIGIMWLGGRSGFHILGIRSNFAGGRDFFKESFLSVALGYGALALFIFLLGVIGFYQGFKFYVALAFYTIVLVYYLVKKKEFIPDLKSLHQSFLNILSLHRNTVSLFFDIGGIFFLLIAFALSFLPPHYYDSLVYHLALPSEYIKNNSIVPVPYNLYSHFPQNAEMTFLIALKVGNEASAQLVTFFLSCLVAVGVRKFIRVNFETEIGASAGFFILASAPFFLFLAPSTYVEFHQAFLSFATFWCMWDYLLKQELPSASRRIFSSEILCAGIFSGLAIGVKYTAFASLAALNIMFIWLYLKKILYGSMSPPSDRKKIIADFFALNASAFFIASPWFIKNFLFTGNPIFPFFYEIFRGSGSSVGWNDYAAQGYFSALTEYAHKSSVFFELVTLPYNLLIKPLKFGGGIDVLGDFGWLVFFVFGALSLLWWRKNFYVLLYAIIVGVIWFLTKPVLRFLVPLAPVLAVLCGMTAGYFMEKKILRPTRIIIFLAIVGCALHSFYYFLFIARYFRPLSYLSGRETKSQYLSNTLKYSPYPAFEFINELHKKCKAEGKSVRVFFVGEQRAFYCKAPLVAPSVFAPNPLVEWADTSSTPVALFLKLRTQKFTLIFYNTFEGERLRPYGIFDFTLRGENIWKEFLARFSERIIYQDKYSIIYDIS